MAPAKNSKASRVARVRKIASARNAGINKTVPAARTQATRRSNKNAARSGSQIPADDPKEDISLQPLRPNLAEIPVRHQALQEEGEADQLLAEVHAMEARATNNLTVPAPSNLPFFPPGSRNSTDT